MYHLVANILCSHFFFLSKFKDKNIQDEQPLIVWEERKI